MGENKRYREEETLRRLYWENGMTMEEMADRLGCSLPTIQTWMNRHSIPRRRTGPKGSIHPSIFTKSSGYEIASARVDGEMLAVRLHRLVAVRESGFDAVSGMHVHHRNGVPWDNRPENLEIVTSSEHARRHAEIEQRDALGRIA